MKQLTFFLIILLSGYSRAEGVIESYSHQDLHNLAFSYKKAFEETMKNQAENLDVGTMIQAAEFKGYVASYLDFSQDGKNKEIVRACASSKRMVEITYEVADLIVNQETNRSVSVHDRFALALNSFCLISISKN